MTEFIRQLIEFVLITVILKVIVAHWLAERILSYAKKLFNSSERNLAIWLHYQAQVSGHGHLASSVLHCADDKCSIFHA